MGNGGNGVAYSKLYKLTQKKKKKKKKENKTVQSDLGYPATSGPAHIRISDLAGYERYEHSKFSTGLNTSYNVFTHYYSICNKLSFICRMDRQ